MNFISTAKHSKVPPYRHRNCHQIKRPCICRGNLFGAKDGVASLFRCGVLGIYSCARPRSTEPTTFIFASQNYVAGSTLPFKQIETDKKSISISWGERRGSNPRHSGPQPDALPAELLPPENRGDYSVLRTNIQTHLSY